MTERVPRLATRALRHAWRLIVLIVGVTVLTIGVAMIVLPGPAFVVIPTGLAILGTEFLWARRLLHRLKDEGSRLVTRVRGESDHSTDSARGS